ncbi:MAG: 16S rRNA (adenine(1518)-N(6)/adenine(1519)-N(6))-dimethyltransferase RsmA [Desulfohalobiaceae bacterium]
MLSWEQAQPAKKALGQNFLLDPNLARKIVSCLQAQAEDKILEIGPGHGALTRHLVQLPAQVLAVEKDLSLAKGLKGRWPELQILVADALSLDWERLHRAKVNRLIGNLPYNVASALIWDLVRHFPLAHKMVFTVQKEVAQRLSAPAGNRIYGGLAVWVRNFARVKYEFTLGPQVFRPRPKVYSAVISLQPYASDIDIPTASTLAWLIKMCFQQRRKQLKNVLKQVGISAMQQMLQELGLDPTCRPEDLTPEQFLRLAKFLHEENPHSSRTNDRFGPNQS